MEENKINNQKLMEKKDPERSIQELENEIGAIKDNLSDLYERARIHRGMINKANINISKIEERRRLDKQRELQNKINKRNLIYGFIGLMIFALASIGLLAILNLV